MPDPALYLTEADVAGLVDLNEAIDALETGLKREAAGETLSIAKALGVFGQAGSLHALGSALPADGLGGFKTWVNVPTGAQAVMEVFDLHHGRLAAILEAGVLGQLRTAGISGVATRWLAAKDADDFALIGAGRQAMMQLAAVAAVRPLKRARVYTRDADRRVAFVAEARALFPFPIEPHEDVADALRDAPIVTLVTRAREPFVSAAMIASGAHVNAVGAILPHSAEFEQDLFDAAGAVVVDSLEGVRRNAREFIDRFGADDAAWDAVTPLSRVLAAADPERPGGGRITIFKAMGMGLSDLSVAALVISRAQAAGVGLHLPAGDRAKPRWRTAPPQSA